MDEVRLLAVSDQQSAISVRRQLWDCLVYSGPHLIAGEGWQLAFDFGETQASLVCAVDAAGLDLTAFGAKQLQLFGLDAEKAFELLKGMVQ